MIDVNLDRFFEVGIAVSAEKDYGKLFGLILNAALDMTNADAGTLYTLNENQLDFNYMITRSKGIDCCAGRDEINIPSVPLDRSHICACCALDKELIHIPDVYNNTEYDFSGAQRYDALNGYHTGSMLVAPMLDENRLCIGVLQLINGDFTEDAEKMILALASFSAVSLNNKLLTEEINDLLHSVVTMMVSAIDARSPYNANHTKNMAKYGEKFIDYCLSHDTSFKIDESNKDPLLMSIWLHDIGKLVIPLEIMDKSTRLGDGYEELMHRITVGILMEEIAGLKDGDVSHEEKKAILTQAREDIIEINGAGFLTDEKLDLVKKYSTLTCLSETGEIIPLLKDEEIANLSILRGTLTPTERAIIESHATYTRSMLNEMNFPKIYKDVPFFASAHHESLDGKGYPDGLHASDIPKEVRLLAIIDIYDALTADDRPYKPPMSAEKAFAILEDMARAGKLDPEILELFITSKAWEK